MYKKKWRAACEQGAARTLLSLVCLLLAFVCKHCPCKKRNKIAFYTHLTDSGIINKKKCFKL